MKKKSLLWGVSVHKIPIGLVIGTMLFQHQSAMTPKIIAILVFALMSPLGSYTANYIEHCCTLSIYFAVCRWCFIHISTTILFESSEGNTFNFQKILAILLGNWHCHIVVIYHLLHKQLPSITSSYRNIHSVW